MKKQPDRNIKLSDLHKFLRFYNFSTQSAGILSFVTDIILLQNFLIQEPLQNM